MSTQKLGSSGIRKSTPVEPSFSFESVFPHLHHYLTTTKILPVSPDMCINNMPIALRVILDGFIDSLRINHGKKYSCESDSVYKYLMQAFQTEIQYWFDSPRSDTPPLIPSPGTIGDFNKIR